jgi:alpha-tubulin suppressor-like RCC1 family protein
LFLKKNKWKKLVAIFMVLGMFLGFSNIIMPGTADASEDAVFTVTINGVEEASFTLAELKAMPATTRLYSNGFYEFTGVDFIYLLEYLNIDYNNWTVKLKSGSSSYVLDSFRLTDPLLAYEEKGIPFFPPNQLKYYYGDNHKNVYQYVAGIEVIKPETLTPPALEADITDNTVGKSIDLTFEDDEAWRDAITEVTVNASAIASDKYTLSAGKLTIDASVFTAAGDYVIAVKATGYEDAAVTQAMVAAPEPAVFTVEINGVETASYTMADLKAMPATIKEYNGGFYKYKGVDFIYLLESLDIDYNNWTVKLKSGSSSYVLDSFRLTEPLLAYEESSNYSEFSPLPPSNLKYYWGDNYKNVYQYVTGIDVIKPEALTPPALEADITDNTVGKSIDLTFEDDETWRDAITEVTVNASAIASDKYTLLAGKLTIDANVFTAAGDYVIAVKATGYDDAAVTQIIKAVAQAVFTIDGNVVDTPVTFTLDQLKAMEATTVKDNKDRSYTGVAINDLLATLGTVDSDWTAVIKIKDGDKLPVNISTYSGYIIAYERDGIPFNDSIGTETMHLQMIFEGGGNIKYVYGMTITKPEPLTAPSLTADITDNTVGKSIDLTFEDDETWRDAITEVTVNASALESDDYTVEAGKLTIDASVFTAAGDYVITVKATGYEDSAVTQTIVGEAVSDTYTVTFSVKDGETAVEGATIEVKNSGGKVVTAEADGTYELEAGDYTYKVTKEGFKDATGTFTVVNEAVAINVVLEKEAVGKVAPVLTASTSGNTVGNPIVIKYTDSYPPQWEPAITAVIVDGVELERWQYNIGFGKLTIAAGIFNEVKDYLVTVKATGYQDATATQTIEAGRELFVSEGKGNIVYVAGKRDHTVAIKDDGTVWAWGDGQSGRLGDGTTGSNNWRSVPGQVSDLTEVIAVAPGEYHTLALKDDGTVWAWGSNSNGVLGNENISGSSSVPVQVITDGETGAALTDIQAIAAGNEHSLALKDDGTVWAWGSKRYGQLGDGKSSWTSSKVPVQVIIDSETGVALTDIQAIAVGDNHSLALKNDGTVWAWGRNYYGQLGTGQSRSSLELSAVSVQVIEDSESGAALTDVKAIAAGQGQSFALKNDGTVWAWGWNGNAQLGNGSTVDSSIPVKVARLTDIQSITAGANHIMALKDDGTIWVWGSNYYGQLGIGADVMSYIPTQLSDESDFAMINAGYYHSLAVKDDGTVWAWGQNTKGKIGNGTTDNYPDDVLRPTQVKLAAQAVVPVAESAILGDAVELEFTDDAAWRESITTVSVDETDLDSEQYTIDTGKITISADVFKEVKDYTITIKAAGFLDAVVTQQIVEEAVLDTYTVTFTVTDGEDAIEGATIQVKDSADEVVVQEEDGTYELETGDYTYTVTKEGFKEATGTFTVESEAVVINVALETEAAETPKYNVIPKEDPVYTIGETEDGIKTMTVNENQTGFKYFKVSIEPIKVHEGTETVVFIHLRDGIQLQLNALEADFDEVNEAKAGFNVNPGDVIKVYVVDKLTNDSDSNPVILQ